MIYTVTWTSDADDTLATILMASPEPQAVTNATDRIDVVLSHDPLKKVEHEHEGLYSYLLWPLAVLCEIDTDNYVVLIVQVRHL